MKRHFSAASICDLIDLAFPIICRKASLGRALPPSFHTFAVRGFPMCWPTMTQAKSSSGRNFDLTLRSKGSLTSACILVRLLP